MKTKEKWIEELEKHIESLFGEHSRMNMIAYCIGYYGAVDSDIFEAIQELWLLGKLEE